MLSLVPKLKMLRNSVFPSGMSQIVQYTFYGLGQFNSFYFGVRTFFGDYSVHFCELQTSQGERLEDKLGLSSANLRTQLPSPASKSWAGGLGDYPIQIFDM